MFFKSGKTKKSYKKIVLPILICSLSLSQATAAKNFIFCSDDDPESFNPMFGTTGSTVNATVSTIYEQLTQFSLDSTDLNPKSGLAEKYTISPDQLTYTFTLRKDIPFHSNKYFTPTRSLNADDIIFSFMRQHDKNHPFHKVSNLEYDYYYGMGMHKTIKSFKKIDDLTVEITLNERDASFLANIAMPHTSIQSAEYADKMLKAGTPELLDTNPIGTGPFQFMSYNKGNDIQYKAFDKYWQGKQPIDNLKYLIIPDTKERTTKIITGECHISISPTPADLTRLRENKDIILLEQPGLNVGYIAFNTTKKPFYIKKIRQALALATNKQAIVDAVYKGTATIAKNPIPPTMWSYDDSITPYSFDTLKAQSMLKDAGLGANTKITLWYMPVSRAYNPDPKLMGEMLKTDWEKAGVNVTLKTFEWSEYLEEAKKGTHQALMLGWIGDNGDPDNFLATLLSCDAVSAGSNHAKWCYQPYDDVVVAARRETDHAKRIELYKKAQAIFKEEMPWIPMAYSNSVQPIRKEVTGFKQNPMETISFIGVDLAK